MRLTLRNDKSTPLSFKELDNNFIIPIMSLVTIWDIQYTYDSENRYVPIGHEIEEIDFDGNNIEKNTNGKTKFFVIYNKTNSDFIFESNSKNVVSVSYSKQDNIAPCFSYNRDKVKYANTSVVIIMTNSSFKIFQAN